MYRLLPLLALCACLPDEATTTATPTPGSEDAAPLHDGGGPDAAPDLEPDPVIDPLPGPGEPGQLQEILPGGDTVCARGTEFRFYSAAGDPERVVIDFGGGGACWDELTCSIAGSLFKEQADSVDELQALIDAGAIGGLYDLDHDDNPLKGWSYVGIPYCTGDIHWGDTVKVYDERTTIHHKGFVNAQTVLRWVYRHYPRAREVLVTGCSAGSYGASLHGAFVARHYDDARVTVLGDSGIGIITDDFFSRSFPSWEAAKNLPDWIPDLQVPIAELDFGKVVVAIANAYPQQRFASYTTAFDADQTFYFQAMGGDRAEWPARARERLAAMRAGAENFRYFVPPGPMHCVLPYHHFYLAEAGGVRFTEWLGALVGGDALPDDAACEGEACYDDPVCAACAEEEGVHCRFCRGWPDDYRSAEE